MRFILQALVLILSFVLVFVWQNTPLSGYTVQILGVLVVVYLIISARRKGQGFLTMGGEGPWGIFILNTIILLLVFATGSISSSLFFLLYFLGFGIAFVFEPPAIFIFIVGAVLVFLPDALRGDAFGNFIKVGSLLLISPLVYFFGREYRKSDKEEADIEALEERTKEAADTISEDVEEVIKDEKANLKEQDVQKLNEILEETEDLREESKK
ncbi:MAG: hypothetical protein M1405_02795 [Patescibacteria group bacterium]|nr:hypothetical protein [Patescibacteria group bacterium]